jgi:tetratricopeptide (TPR) repeat protein
VKVYTDLNILTNELCSIVDDYIEHAELPMTIFKQKYEEDQSTNLLNKFAYFVEFWKPLFIDLLLDFPQSDYEEQKAKFIQQCRIYYRANEKYLEAIDEFEKTYKPELSIVWYKKNSFLYRLLNKVMRQQNIQGILTIRFFILDLYKQLKETYRECLDDNYYEYIPNPNVYRGQMMFVNEFKNLKTNYHANLKASLKHATIISVNSFFSASRELNVALNFAGINSTDASTSIIPIDKKPVLFEITIDMEMSTACLTGQAWVALKRKQYDLAVQLALESLSNDTKSNDELTITTFNCLAGIYWKLKNYPEALKYYKQAYDISKPTDEKIVNHSYHGPCIPIDKHAMYDNYQNISSINIARIHQERGNTQLAWNMFKVAIDCDMRDRNDFHCHTCMTIAESGTHETNLTPEEHNRR